MPVRGSDGRYHVVYELLVTNTTSKPATLNSVRVLNAASGRGVTGLGFGQTGQLLSDAGIKPGPPPAEGGV